MKRNIFKIISAIMFFLCMQAAYAQEMPAPLDKKEKNKVIETVVAPYSNWGRVSLTGKLSSDLLPATATVKVYMEKDNLTLISVSAPIVGEVARIELDHDNLLIVNKWSKKYLTITTGELESIYPDAQCDLQNLLLGRITLMGKGSLNKKSGNDVDVYNIGGGEMMIVPIKKYQPEGGTYAYVVSGLDMLLSQFIMMSEENNEEMNCSFQWGKDGKMTMDFSANANHFNLDGKISFDSPAWGANSFGRFELTSKYSPTTLRGILQM